MVMIADSRCAFYSSVVSAAVEIAVVVSEAVVSAAAVVLAAVVLAAVVSEAVAIEACEALLRSPLGTAAVVTLETTISM
jgi:hypothetical protein